MAAHKRPAPERSPATWQAHCELIVATLSDALRVKYDAGYREHGGNLWEKSGALANLEEKLLDAPTYLYTAREQLRQMAEDGKSAADACRFLFGERPGDG